MNDSEQLSGDSLTPDHMQDVVRIETGSRPFNPSLERAWAFADALGVPLTVLFPKRRRSAA